MDGSIESIHYMKAFEIKGCKKYALLENWEEDCQFIGQKRLETQIFLDPRVLSPRTRVLGPRSGPGSGVPGSR